MLWPIGRYSCKLAQQTCLNHEREVGARLSVSVVRTADVQARVLYLYCADLQYNVVFPHLEPEY